jgi:hypothetical protein
MARLRQEFGVELPLRLVFEFPTIRGLASAIRRELGEREEARLERHEVIGRRSGERELSFAQQRLWFLSRLEPGPHYNEHFDLRLTGVLDVEALEKALNGVVRRHEVLRSRVEEVEGEPRVRVEAEEGCRLQVEGCLKVESSELRDGANGTNETNGTDGKTGRV